MSTCWVLFLPQLLTFFLYFGSFSCIIYFTHNKCYENEHESLHWISVQVLCSHNVFQSQSKHFFLHLILKEYTLKPLCYCKSNYCSTAQRKFTLRRNNRSSWTWQSEVERLQQKTAIFMRSQWYRSVCVCVWIGVVGVGGGAFSHLAARNLSWNRRQRIAAVSGCRTDFRWCCCIVLEEKSESVLAAVNGDGEKKELRAEKLLCLRRSPSVREKLFVFWPPSASLYRTPQQTEQVWGSWRYLIPGRLETTPPVRRWLRPLRPPPKLMKAEACFGSFLIVLDSSSGVLHYLFIYLFNYFFLHLLNRLVTSKWKE